MKPGVNNSYLLLVVHQPTDIIQCAFMNLQCLKRWTFEHQSLWEPFEKHPVKYAILSVPVGISKVYMFIVVCPESSKLCGPVCLLRNDCNCTSPADTFPYISNIP